MAVSIIASSLSGILAWILGYKTYIKEKKIWRLLLYICIGAAAGAVFHVYGWLPSKVVRYLILIYGMLLIAHIDYKNHIIPNQLLLCLLGIRFVLLIIELISYSNAVIELLSSAFGGMFIGFFIFLIAYYISKKGIGMGDVKLIAVIGFYTGASVLYGIMIISLLCCVVYSVVQLIRRKLTTKDFVAFGPFVAIGTVLALFLGI
ncbi:MAG: A24 family peptidase [Roseburia sp.]|nr:A24 family peptidase [Roseburia sp.]MCM1278552.1 A24 family peptidase [Robinsoniella sp.]